MDEAAQALECELVVALARKPKRCLLVGDPAQLPATMASETARRKGHDRSCMRRVLDVAAEDEKNFDARRGARGNARDANVSPLDSWYTLLDTQYCMHPAISELPVASVLRLPRARRRVDADGSVLPQDADV